MVNEMTTEIQVDCGCGAHFAVLVPDVNDWTSATSNRPPVIKKCPRCGKEWKF